MRPQIRYVADCTYSGYGNAARGNLRALEALGWGRNQVRVFPAVFWRREAMDAPDNDWLKRTYIDAYDGRPDPEGGINIVHAHPCFLSQFWSAGWYNIACTAWETNQLPKAIYPGTAGTKDRTVTQTINECYDELWVPTGQVRKVFLAGGVTKPITVVPHALLPELMERPPKSENVYIPDLHPRATGGTGSPCRFYSIGTWDLRKDPVRLLRAYYSTGWRIYQSAELLMHTTSNGREQQHDVENLRATHPDWVDLPSMSICSGAKSYSWLLDVHENSHVLATATHGEGFCLPVAEALAMGNLVLGPRGPLEHFDWALEAGFIVPVPTHEEEIAIMPDHAGYEIGQTWHGCSVADLTKGFEDALDRARNGLLPLREGAEEARRRYSVGALAGVMKPRLEEAQRALEAKAW